LATPGKVDKKGCHDDKRGYYHCHPGVKGGSLTHESLKRRSDDNFRRYVKNNQQPKPNVSTPAFNPASWGGFIDQDNDCQYTNDEVLSYFSRSPVDYKAGQKCQVKSGKWVDQFTGKYHTFANQLIVGHIVPPSYAHQSGADTWSDKQKQQFFNDPVNLVPMSKAIAQVKGHSTPVEWMPPNQKFHCLYLKQWLKVARKYKLKRSHAEDVFFKYELKNCR
jgi:hypothetical protein